MYCEISRSIKSRKVAKDTFYTPDEVAKKHISLVSCKGLWLDPFRGKGAYYNNFKEEKDWCEITDGVDFFDYAGKPDVIISNPPYSMIDKIIKKSIELQPTIISYLLLHGSMTTRRMEIFNSAGYGLTSIYMTKVYDWYGMSEAYTFEKGKPNVATITYDRIVHR